MKFLIPDTLLRSFLVMLCFSIVGCSKSFNPDIERGSSYNFKEGHPEVRFSAIGLLDDEGNPKINLAADIVYGSLIYSEENNAFVSNIAIDIQIIKQNESKDIIASKQYTLKVEEDDPNVVYNQESFDFQRALPADPGKYKIHFTLTDLNSDKRITSTDQVFIPNPENDITNLTNIKMLGKNMGSENPAWSPITTYDVPGRIDSLKFIFQVTNNNSDTPLTVQSRLLRFKSDTTPARPMHYNNYTPSSIQYKGIDYDEQEIIQSSQRKLIEAGNVLIEFTFGQQERGNYRFDVNATKSSDNSGQFKARDFSVKSKNYPSVKSAYELARPLVYLMGEKEYDKLMKINDADSLKKAIDRFWLKEIGNKHKTKDVIKKYYNRVEEANKQFSNFKEGWKTDTGFIYIIFGPPWYIDTRLNEMHWSYSYNRTNPERNYYFFQPQLKSEFFPFDHYLLRRSSGYFSVQYQQKQLWLSGYILQRNL